MRRARSRVSRNLSGRSLLRGGFPRRRWRESEVDRVKRRVRERDLYLCKVCGRPGKEVHHVDYDDTHNVLSNMVTLCRACHPKTNQNREGWMNYFIALGFGESARLAEEKPETPPRRERHGWSEKRRVNMVTPRKLGDSARYEASTYRTLSGNADMDAAFEAAWIIEDEINRERQIRLEAWEAEHR